MNAARQTRGVQEAEGRQSLTLRARTGPDAWHQLQLFAIAGINVLEPTRESGVMRAIGASNGAVMRIALVEGPDPGLWREQAGRYRL